MQPVRVFYALVFIASTCANAGEVPAPITQEPELEIRRAIPVEEELPPTTATSNKIVYTRCEVPAPVIAITFDDGPHPEFTPRLLDILKERGIKATFFLVGQNVAAYPAIVRRMVEEGHQVANHSWSHPLLTQLSAENVEKQLRRTHDAIVTACGVAPLLYRPPYGQVRLSQRKRIHETFHYPAILWDVDPQDWQSPRTVKKVHDRVLAQTRSGSIILCHDIHETTVAAMPSILDELKTRGYQFATVSQLMELEASSAPPVKVEIPTAVQLSDPLPTTVPSP